MLTKSLELAVILLITFSFCCGISAPFFADRRTIRKAYGFWMSGLVTGIAGMTLSVTLVRILEAAQTGAAGGEPGQMDGYGDALLGFVGGGFFLATFVLINLIYISSTLAQDKVNVQASPKA